MANLQASLLNRFRAKTTDSLSKFVSGGGQDELRLVCSIQQALLVIILEQARWPPGSPNLQLLTKERERLASKLAQLRGAGSVELLEATSRASNMNI